MKKIFILLILIIPVISNSLFAQTTAQDSAALVNLYNNTDGVHWDIRTNWLTSRVGTWYGVELSSTTRKVYRLELSNNNLSDTLPNSIGSLAGLDWLDLRYNELAGWLPDTLVSLINLRYLNLRGNNFTGSLPEDFGDLESLVYLYLDENNFKGDLPDLSNIGLLQNLSVSHNKFTFTNLEASGFINGSIAIFNYSPQDTILGVSSNQLAGTIEVDIEDDTQNTYKWYKNGILIDLDERVIIPQGKGLYDCKITNAKFPGLTLYSDTLNFNYTTISDSIALVAIYNKTEGVNWINKTNWLTGTLDTWFGVTLDTERRVRDLGLNKNSLTGLLPENISNLTHLASLNLDSNKIEGTIPYLGWVDSLDEVSIKNNLLMFGDISNSGIQPGDISSLIYSPQDTFPFLSYNHYDVSLTVNDVTDTSNVYSWFKDGVLTDDSTRTIVIYTEGLYNCVVSNTVYPGLEFESDTFEFTFSPATDSIALVHLYNETGGASWTSKTSWLTGRLSTWYGVSLDLSGRVSRVVLPRNNIRGVLPNEIGNLTHLEVLDLNNNQLSGDLPVEIGNLAILKGLRLFHNQLEGKIPEEIGNLTLLNELRLESNLFGDTIPDEIYGLTQLQNLNLSGNSLVGEISAQIGNLTNLTWLSLADNLLDGTIPAEIGNLVKLNGIELNDNNFTGTIPNQLFLLNDLTFVSFGNNSLSGTIPNDFRNLLHLNYLSLGGNQFTGKIPSGIGSLTELTDLYLNDNNLTDTITTAIGYLTSLNTLNLSGNRLSGSIPAALGNLNGLLNLYLDSNLFIGDLPDLSDFPYLSELSVENNQFTFSSLSSTGIIPSAIDEFSYSPQDTVFGLQYQFLNNSLTVLDDVETGNIYNWYRDTVLLEEEDRIITLTGEGGYHCEVGNILYPDLKILSDTFSFSYSVLTDSVSLVTLYNETNGSSWINKSNWLTGRLNTWYGVTLDVNNRVSKLILNGNNLTDTIPAEIGSLTHLTELNLQSNNLSGGIPVEIGEMDSLSTLMLNSNQFSGEIPAEIGNLKKLSTLYLDNNQFTGSIPVILGNLTNLTRLTLHSNNFSGIIPTQLSNCTKLIVLNLGKNNLSGSIPESFGNLDNLQSLYLSNNQFGGNIPSMLGGLSALRTLNLSNNLFTGLIPTGLGNIDNLMNLDLSGNDLSGEIPDDLSFLSSFQFFNISDNNFRFTELEPLWDWANFDDFRGSFQYSPQPKIGVASVKSGNLSAPLILRIEEYLPGENDKFQWYKNDVLLSGETDSVLVIPSFALSDTGAYYCNVNNDLATLLTLTSENIIVRNGEISDNVTLANIAFNNGDIECYGALQSITVAGGGSTVILNSGATISFVAGRSIRFLPGFHAISGSNMDAHITQDATFCDEEDKSVVMADYQAIKERRESNTDKYISEDKTELKVYPNPSDGRFTIELSDEVIDSEVLIYNISGSEIVRFKIGYQNSLQVNIDGIENGIYFIKVTNLEGQNLVHKIIIK